MTQIVPAPYTGGISFRRRKLKIVATTSKTKFVYRLIRSNLSPLSKTNFLFNYTSIRPNLVRSLQWRPLFINKQTNKNIRFYSTKQRLDPFFITGFTDGCFRVNIIKDNKSRTGWLIQPSFQIDLHERDIELLQEIQRYFGGRGNILKKPLGQLIYRVGSFAHIIEVIIPHFDTYPLITDKQADYLLFRAVIIDIMREKKHLTLQGVKDIVAIKTSLNKGLSDNLKAAFPNLIPYNRPDRIDKKIPDPHWMAGFTSFSSTTRNLFIRTSGGILTCASLIGKSALFSKGKPAFIKQFSSNYSTSSTSLSLSLVVWGENLASSVGTGRFTKQVRYMIILPPYQYSVMVGLIMSDGSLRYTKASTSPLLYLTQSLDHSGYIWFVFFILSHYCNNLPKYRCFFFRRNLFQPKQDFLFLNKKLNY